MKHTVLAAFAALFLSTTAALSQAAPFPICAGPVGGGLPAGYVIEERDMIEDGKTRWYCLVTPPGYTTTGPDYPLVVVLHGGNGNPQKMMEGSKRIMKEGLDRGYVLIFPAGIGDPDRCSTAFPCEHNLWNGDTNVVFLNSLIAEAAQFNLDETRIYLAGFSGGAQLIYSAIEADSFPYPIAAIATAAGGLGQLKVSNPAGGLQVINVAIGTPTDAVLFQGKVDVKLAFAGGLSDGNSEVHLPFTVKVDLFRTLTGNTQDPGTAIGAGPATVTSYTLGSNEVVAISDPAVGHVWPGGLSATVFDFFDTH